MRLLIEWHEKLTAQGNTGLLDETFIAQHTHGFQSLRNVVLNSDWHDIVRISGLTYDQIEKLVDIYSRSEKTIICYGKGDYSTSAWYAKFTATY